ncbi:aminopeptidase P family N-terminal domain-containing protein [Rhodococcus wratislaviensis]|uniref:aminopeptidase P family N-terminal domain-containing protein n=1 Tax=Rhodococcus wratislaviensis TaxID=44752 RepID=UPI003516BBA8
MTSLVHPTPFTGDDYAARMVRVVHDAVAVGLDGVLVTPGPDLVWLAGYRPTAITERLTILVLRPDRQPAMVVPALERPDAESAEGTAAVSSSNGPMAPIRIRLPVHYWTLQADTASPTPPGRCTYWACNDSCRARRMWP